MAARMGELLADAGEIDRLLTAGAARAQAIAEPAVRQVSNLMGFWQPPKRD